MWQAILGGLSMGASLGQGIAEAVKGRKEAKKQEAQERQAASSQAKQRFTPEAEGVIAPVSVRPDYGNPGLGFGTVASMMPSPAQQQNAPSTPIFQMKQPGEQQRPSPEASQGGNFSSDMLTYGVSQPKANRNGPQTAPAFSAIGAYLNNGRRG